MFVSTYVAFIQKEQHKQVYTSHANEGIRRVLILANDLGDGEDCLVLESRQDLLVRGMQDSLYRNKVKRERRMAAMPENNPESQEDEVKQGILRDQTILILLPLHADSPHREPKVLSYLEEDRKVHDMVPVNTDPTLLTV